MNLEQLVNINPKAADQKLYVVNKYIQLLLLIIFGLAIFKLYIKQAKSDDRLIEYISKDGKETVKEISENKNAVNRVNTTLEEIKTVMTELKEIMRESQRK